MGVGPFGDGGLGAEHAPQLRYGGAALLVLVEQLHQGLDRGEKRGQEQQEGDHFAEAELVAQHHAAADQQDHGLRDDAERLGARPVQGLCPAGGEVGVEVGADDVVVSDRVVAAPVEGGDEPDPVEALGEVGEHVGDPVPYPQVADRRHLPEPQGQQHVHRGHDGKADQCQRGVEYEQVGGDHYEGHALHDELDEALLEQHGQGLDVGGHPCHQHPGAFGGEEAQRLALEVAEHPDSQLVDEAFADTAGEGGAQGGGECGQHDRHDEHECDGHEDAGVLGEHAPVDAALHQQRPEVQQGRFDDDQQHGEGQATCVGAQEGAQPERPPVPVAVREVDDRIWVLGLVLEHGLDAAGEVAGHVGERQAGVGVGLHRRGADGEAPTGVSEAHQGPPFPASPSYPSSPDARMAA